ncbi:hypothetical protein CR513_45249, partial [Mucuna pruriens]
MHFILKDPFPHLNRAFCLVPQQEMLFQIRVIDGLKLFINATEGENILWQMKGHTIDPCYKKRGYPPTYVPRNSYADNVVNRNNTIIIVISWIEYAPL